MKITACAIVKNEADNIARSIESYKDAVDEIIIVDTGSTDDTVAICKKFGAKVLFYDWKDDFAACKNYALGHAQGDWIIFLDADEWFVPKLKRTLIMNVLTQINKQADGLMTTMCQYNIKIDKVFSREKTTRIFRNSSKIRYHGSIHERLKNEDKELTQAHCPDIEIFHSGYADGMQDKNKQRNIEILYKLYNQGKVSTYLYYYLFRENYFLGNIDEAVKFYEIFMEQGDADKVIKNDSAIICVYEFMYAIMLQAPQRYNQHDIDKLLQEAYKKYPELPMHSYMLGCDRLKTEGYSESYDWLNNAINLNNKFLEPFTNSFVAYIADTYCKMGYIQQIQGNAEQALECYIEALKTAGTLELASILPGLIEIVENQNQEEIILFLNSLLNMNTKEHVEAILAVLKKTRLHKAFIYYAVKYNQEFDGQDDTTYTAMIMTGQAGKAVETAIESYKNTEIISNHNITQYNWHIDYAVIGVVYNKNCGLYERYRNVFTPEQRTIIEAYLKEKKISEASQELKAYFEKIYNMIFYIVSQTELEKFREILD